MTNLRAGEFFKNTPASLSIARDREQFSKKFLE